METLVGPVLNFICISKINTGRTWRRCAARGTIDYFELVNSDLKQNARRESARS